MGDTGAEPLSTEDCLRLLRAGTVGRIAVLDEGFPIVLPVNYRLVETSTLTWIAIRTRIGGVIDLAPINAAFEIDNIDVTHHEAWSVLARGTLQHIYADVDFRARFDPEPWVIDERDAWLAIDPFAITGRHLLPTAEEWTFHLSAYL